MTTDTVSTLSKEVSVATTVLPASLVLSPPTSFIADPFIVKGPSQWQLFFELFNTQTKKGEIGLAESNDLQHWSFKQVVLREPFHLSYPFVFTYRGHHYMVPESRQNHSIRLYRATRYPTEWRLERTLIRGNFSDSSLVYYKGLWWLFTCQAPYSLHIFYASSPQGPWKPHALNPVYLNDPSRARPGGQPLILHGKLIRFVQDNRHGYGKALRAMEVKTLTPSSFSEHPLAPDPLLRAHGSGWARNGMHHLSAVQLPDHSLVVAVDGSGSP